MDRLEVLRAQLKQRFKVAEYDELCRLEAAEAQEREEEAKALTRAGEGQSEADESIESP